MIPDLNPDDLLSTKLSTRAPTATQLSMVCYCTEYLPYMPNYTPSKYF